MDRRTFLTSASITTLGLVLPAFLAIGEPDAFDQWWEWTERPPESHLEIPVEIWRPVSRLSPEDRLDRRTVNEAVANHNEPDAG